MKMTKIEIGQILVGREGDFISCSHIIPNHLIIIMANHIKHLGSRDYMTRFKT